jgi:hypothetical protein
MTTDTTQADPAITSAEIMYREQATIGSRVKHYGQRYTGCATATIIGFRLATPREMSPRTWVKVLVEHDEPNAYDQWDWDWDRTELAPD